MKEQLPDGFKPYTRRSMGNGRDCVAGIATDGDGLKQRPVIAVTGEGARTVVWARQLDGIEDAYQARATHCVQGDDALYVLLQSDTHSSPALSQTLLSVVRLDSTGAVLGVGPVEVPGTEGQAYSAYVNDMPADVAWKDGRLVVKGEYFLKSSPDARKPFVAEIAMEGGQV